MLPGCREQLLQCRAGPLGWGGLPAPLHATPAALGVCSGAGSSGRGEYPPCGTLSADALVNKDNSELWD